MVVGKFIRMAPNWAVTPHMQVRILHHLARTRNLPISAEFLRGTPALLLQILCCSRNIYVPIVTFLWFGRRPNIYYAN